MSLTQKEIRQVADAAIQSYTYYESETDVGSERAQELAIEFIMGEWQGERPTIVTLCGSTRFYDAWQRANYEETMAGRIVLMVGFYPHSQNQAHGEQVGCTPEQKIALDELHLRKIDLCDEILILNVGGYIGESTSREIAYAIEQGKRTRYLEPSS